MTTLSLDSRPVHPGLFHVDIHWVTVACAFAVAMIVCLLNGDIAAIPALLCLAAMTSVASGVQTTSNAGTSSGRCDDGAHRTKYQRMHLWRRHSLEQ